MVQESYESYFIIKKQFASYGVIGRGSYLK